MGCEYSVCLDLAVKNEAAFINQSCLFFAQEGQDEMVARARGFRPSTFSAEGSASEILEKAYSLPELPFRLVASDGGTDPFSGSSMLLPQRVHLPF